MVISHVANCEIIRGQPNISQTWLLNSTKPLFNSRSYQKVSIFFQDLSGTSPIHVQNCYPFFIANCEPIYHIYQSHQGSHLPWLSQAPNAFPVGQELVLAKAPLGGTPRKLGVNPRFMSTLVDLVGGDWNMNFIFLYIGNNHPN